MINPLLIAKGLKVKKFLEENKFECTQKAIFIEKAKNSSGVVLVFQYQFPTMKEAEIFRDMYELAEKVEL